MFRDLSKFIDIKTSKCPPMNVQVINKDAQVIYTYDVPANFQLDLFVKSLYPNAEFMISQTHLDFDVSVALPGELDLHEIHHGVYRIFPMKRGSNVNH